MQNFHGAFCNTDPNQRYATHEINEITRKSFDTSCLRLNRTELYFHLDSFQFDCGSIQASSFGSLERAVSTSTFIMEFSWHLHILLRFWFFSLHFNSPSSNSNPTSTIQHKYFWGSLGLQEFDISLFNFFAFWVPDWITQLLCFMNLESLRSNYLLFCDNLGFPTAHYHES